MSILPNSKTPLVLLLISQLSCSHQHHSYYSTFLSLSVSPLSHQFNSSVLSKAFQQVVSSGPSPSPLSPVQLQSEAKDILSVCEGTFPLLPSCPGVESSSAQLLLHSELTRERHILWREMLGPRAVLKNFWPTSNAKTPQLISTATYCIWLNMWQVLIFPLCLCR